MSLYVITANDLRDGFVIYLGDNGCWTGRLDEGRLFGEAELPGALVQGVRAEESQQVVGVYELEVASDGGCVRPTRLRERIRAFGPSTHVDFARADVPGHLIHPDGVKAVRFGAA
ncbi:MAG: DUF2849 domain-containing protein [Rhodospirillaceae bacterium]|jgi:hypothetical protein|nr:DUF2849 domain-containing protein [Rhodospirillaceae bacterium]